MSSPDEFPLEDGDPLAKEHDLVSRFLEEDARRSFIAQLSLQKTEAGREIAAAPPEAARDLVRALLPRILHLEKKAAEVRARASPHQPDSDAWEATWGNRQRLADLLQVLLKRKPPLDSSDLENLIEWLLEAENPNPSWYPVGGILTAAETLSRTAPLPEPAVKKLQSLAERLRQNELQAPYRKLAERVEQLTGSAPAIRIQPGEAWSDQALADLAALEPSRRAAWGALLAHALTATSARPSAKWTKGAQPLLEAVGMEDFKAMLLAWFPLFDRPRTSDRGQPWRFHPLTIIPPHADLLRGLIWCAASRQDAEIARALAALAASAFKKIPGTGPRAPKVGNACLYALGSMPGTGGAAQLAIVKARVKVRSAQKGIETALAAAAERAGLSRDDLEELAVPAHGLGAAGRRIEPMGDFTAELSVTGALSTQLEWVSSQGKRQSSVPAAVKRGFAAELKALKQAEKDIQKMLSAQAERLDRLVLEQKTWPFAAWRQRYLDHPLVGILARRLIWRFQPPGAGAAGAAAGQDPGCAPLLVTGSGAVLQDMNGDGVFDPIAEAVRLLNWAFLGGPAPVKPCAGGGPSVLPDTGQAACYSFDASQSTWVEVPCGEAACAGQDGAYATGCPINGTDGSERFVVNDGGTPEDTTDDTVTDTCTGLMWQRETADVNGDGSSTDQDFLP